MQWYNWVLIVLGICVTADGFGSVLIKGGQYHGWLFDDERYMRAAWGIIIIILGLIIP